MTWRLEMDAELGLYQICDEQGEFARVTAVRDDHANARLIAAAPDLLEALKLARSMMRAMYGADGCPLSEVGRQNVATIDAAIARAEGQQ